ncbi:MAG: hypothetical protein DI566_06530 [Microbacterium sp.]|nr:MAG: hypothetical protein DI566_06530 [Microbacterium sp.]
MQVPEFVAEASAAAPLPILPATTLPAPLVPGVGMHSRRYHLRLGTVEPTGPSEPATQYCAKKSSDIVSGCVNASTPALRSVVIPTW